jgi:ribonuclease P protein component
MKTSKSLKIRDLSFKYSPSSRPGLGLVVSKKYGDSVKRNLFKRRCRSLFKTTIIDNKIFCSVVVRPNGQNISLKSINESFALLYNKLVD